MLPGAKKYPHVFSPGYLGKMEVKNRIKYASTETNFNFVDGLSRTRRWPTWRPRPGAAPGW